jgi:hypothetical protein
MGPLDLSVAGKQPAGGNQFSGDIANPDVRFIPRFLAQVCLPYTDPGQREMWQRVNGDLTLTIHSDAWPTQENEPHRIGLPYGLYPRLLLMFLTTMAVRTRTPVIQVPSHRQLMRSLGIPKSATSSRNLTQQLMRLASCSISVLNQNGSDSQHLRWWRFASGLTLNADGHPHLSTPLEITLSEEFFETIVRSPIPVDDTVMQHLRGRNSSGLALDVYWWLTHRSWKVREPQRISWKQLEVQFGNQYDAANAHKWRARFLAAVDKVLEHRPDIRCARDERVFVILPTNKKNSRPRLSRSKADAHEWTVIHS